MFQEKPYQLLLGDCRERLKDIPTNTVDAVVTDPPYELGFMGKSWDASGIAYSVEMWKEVLRVMKPGAHILAFSGTRTYHRMVVAMEDAGFEIRDQLQWIYGSGFPKSLDVSKAIDKCFGKKPKTVSTFEKKDSHAEWAVEGEGQRTHHNYGKAKVTISVTEPTSDLAKQWKGWGTALKPANEPIVLARKPLEKDSVAKNVLKWGTGGINVDAGRIEAVDQKELEKNWDRKSPAGFGNGLLDGGLQTDGFSQYKATGRFPANVLFDEGAARMLDEMSGTLKNGGQNYRGETGESIFGNSQVINPTTFAGDSGGASRFFYTAKTSKWERNYGLDGMPKKRGGAEQYDSRWKEGTGENRMPMNQNSHPTVKPFTLMRYLVNLITPPGGVVLDPFLGSGTTGAVSVACGFKFIGIEMTPEYMEIAKGRIGSVKLNEVID